LPEVTSKHSELCVAIGITSGFVQVFVAMVPAWHLRQRPLVLTVAACVLVAAIWQIAAARAEPQKV